MTDAKHIPAPKFCEACELELVANLPADRLKHAGYCPHHATLAQVRREPGGRIRSWRLMGPLTEEQAAFVVEFGAGVRNEIFSRSRPTH